MSEEKKIYSITGTVTICTDEYRDLIERAVSNEKEAELSDQKRWSEYRRAESAEKNLSVMTEKYNELETFIHSDAEVYKMFMAWKAEKEREQ